jgi:hypothetical protein
MCLTRVISDVRASISRSSAVRSAKPGRTCLAWSFSSAPTIKLHISIHNSIHFYKRKAKKKEGGREEGLTLWPDTLDNLVDFLAQVDPAGRQTGAVIVNVDACLVGIAQETEGFVLASLALPPGSGRVRRRRGARVSIREKE